MDIVVQISECVINRFLEQDLPLNTSKLQKILYFMQKEHLQRYNKPMFSEDIFAGKEGPVIPIVEKCFSAGLLGFDVEVEENISLMDKHREILDSVVKKYGNISSIDMAIISKDERSWKTVWDNGNGENKILPLDLIILD